MALSALSAMASFRLMHCRTGTVLPGYRVTAATESEIAKANHRLKQRGSEYRFVVDLHPPVKPAPVCDGAQDSHPVQAPTPTPA